MQGLYAEETAVNSSPVLTVDLELTRNTISDFALKSHINVSFLVFCALRCITNCFITIHLHGFKCIGVCAMFILVLDSFLHSAYMLTAVHIAVSGCMFVPKAMQGYTFY